MLLHRYVTELLRCTPSALKFLRYNAFIVLYPLGLVGEVCGLLLALDAYRAGLCPPSFPNCTTNSVGLYAAYAYLLVAVPGKRAALQSRSLMHSAALISHRPAGFLLLYTHMFAQRAKHSGPNKEGHKKTK